METNLSMGCFDGSLRWITGDKSFDGRSQVDNGDNLSMGGLRWIMGDKSVDGMWIMETNLLMGCG